MENVPCSRLSLRKYHLRTGKGSEVPVRLSVSGERHFFPDHIDRSILNLYLRSVCLVFGGKHPSVERVFRTGTRYIRDPVKRIFEVVHIKVQK